MTIINSYEELVQLAQERQKDRLVLEVDMGSTYSAEHEEAKKELQQAKAVNTLAGEQGFLSDNIERLQQRVRDTKPPATCVWLVYSRLGIKDWSLLVKQGSGLTPMQQYEKVLPQTFVGIFNSEDAQPEHLLTDDPNTVSSESDNCLISGGVLNNVIRTFMQWQNAGGDVNIHPVK